MLRCLLASSYLQDGNALALFTRFQEHSIADIMLNNKNMSVERREDELLRRIHEKAERQGTRSLRDAPGFPVPSEKHAAEAQREDQRLQNNHEFYSQVAQENFDKFKGKQRAVAEGIIGASMGTTTGTPYVDGKLFFVQGEAGTGKTFMLDTIRKKLESHGKHVAITATPGIAASMYEGGRTVHGLLGIGVPDKDAADEHTITSRYSPQTQRAEYIRKLSLLIVDEASMLQKSLLHTSHHCCQNSGPQFSEPV